MLKMYFAFYLVVLYIQFYSGEIFKYELYNQSQADLERNLEVRFCQHRLLKAITTLCNNVNINYLRHFFANRTNIMHPIYKYVIRPELLSMASIGRYYSPESINCNAYKKSLVDECCCKSCTMLNLFKYCPSDDEARSLKFIK
uniref:Insulin-like prohormone-1 n=1 Tax=Schmidtea mediterranea TaxID=79327 RepID=E3CTK9_SCHMD|nr:TPA_inf: insulin-like prohormone-1 [Schmidtea mediterranea]